jgi:hypothetical protein
MEELDVVFPKELELYFEICASPSMSAPTVSTMSIANKSTMGNVGKTMGLLEGLKLERHNLGLFCAQ